MWTAPTTPHPDPFGGYWDKHEAETYDELVKSCAEVGDLPASVYFESLHGSKLHLTEVGMAKFIDDVTRQIDVRDAIRYSLSLENDNSTFRRTK